MIKLKNSKEIGIMQKGGDILSLVLDECLRNIKPGVSEIEIDNLAEELIKKHGAIPGFKMVDGYFNSTCISTNNVVVHGIPTEYRFEPGDIVGVDCGVFLDGFNTDMSGTVVVPGKEDEKIKKFVDAGKEALDAAIKEAIIENRIGDISKKIQDIIEGKNGYSVVRSLVGHGVGRDLHEDPEIPGFLDKEIAKTAKLKEGMTIAIEIIYNMGDPEVLYVNDDGWTISTKDGSVSGLFEKTVAITIGGPQVLTK